MKASLITPEVAFFLANAGYSYNPKTETPEEGKLNSAIALAEAEAKGKDIGLHFGWEQDDVTTEDFSDEAPFYPLWICTCYFEGQPVAGLGGIDLGADGQPHSKAYPRVIQAELAAEALESVG